MRWKGFAVVAAVVATGAAVIVAPNEQPHLAAAPAATTSTTVWEPKLIEAAFVEAPTTVATAPPATVRKASVKPKPAGDGLHDENKKDTRPVPKPLGLPLGSPYVGAYSGTEIEGFAHYEGQSTCDPTPKAGTLALRDILLARYPTTKSLGVSRDCAVGGQSEHKEGRAFDWGADLTDGNDNAAVLDFLTALLAPDAQGNNYALARRMGVMYVIWNRQIWGIYDAQAGWRPYDGANPHTDHVHISLTWAGGRGETSFFSGNVLKGLPTFTGKPPRTTTTRPPRTTTTRPSRSSTTSTPTTWRPRSTTTTLVGETTTSAPTTSSTTTSTWRRHRR